MNDFIAQDTLNTIATLAHELNGATTALQAALDALQTTPDKGIVTPQEFVERILSLDEQISRTRLLLPLCTGAVQINEGGRTLALSDLITEVRSEFDALARAQLEALINDSPKF